MKIIRIASGELNSFLEKWREQGIKLFVSEGNDHLSLMQIVVPPEMRDQGIGTELMNELVALGNRLGKRIVLTPDTTYGGTSVNRLKEFYKRFGFMENKGRNKDFSISETMYREPTPV